MLKYIQIHIQKKLYLSKIVKNHDLFEAICGNSQVSDHHDIQFENLVSTQMNFNMLQEEIHPTKHLDNLPFEETNVHIQQCLPNEPYQLETFFSTSRTSSTWKRKLKAKHKIALIIGNPQVGPHK